MREKIKFGGEADRSSEKDLSYEDIVASPSEVFRKENPNRHKKDHKSGEHIEQILSKIEKTAYSRKELSSYQTIKHRKEHTGPKYISGELRQTSLKRSLKKTREGLKPYQKPFSKLIHNDVVEQISEVAAKTIARPEGLLTGATTAFFVSLGILLICSYYGYEYNYLISLISFVLGYSLALTTKFISSVFRR